MLEVANAAKKNGMGGFVLCDLPDIDAPSSAGRISEPTREALTAAKQLRVRLAGYGEAQARRFSARRERATAEAGPLRGGLVAMVAGWDALRGDGPDPRRGGQGRQRRQALGPRSAEETPAAAWPGGTAPWR